MNNDKKNILKGVCYGIAGTLACMVLLGSRKSGLDLDTGVNVDTGESVLVIHNKKPQVTPSIQSVGRYQLSAWSTGWKDGGEYGAFLPDTTNGQTKIVYNCLVSKQGKKNVTIDNLNKPFEKVIP